VRAQAILRRAGLTLAALLALAGANVGLAFVPLGAAQGAVAVAVAAAMAAVVATMFLDVGRATRVAQLAALAGLVVLAVMVGLTLSDVATRPPV
jgi:cytochrome c oxidase subunit IV